MRQYKNQGFTLLEVMVALAILAIASSTLLLIRNNAVSDSMKAIKTRQLQNLLEQKMTEAIANIETKNSGDFSQEGFPYYQWKIQESPKVLTSTSPDTGKPFQIVMKEIFVTVYHAEEQEIQYSLKTTVLLEKPDKDDEDDKKK